MGKTQKVAISPTREEDYAEWYQQVIKASDLAEHSPVRGCMVIKPWGYRLWEKIKESLDKKFKETGHENAYFPLFIPLSYLQKEAEHVEGFAKECAVVTHHKLEKSSSGELVPSGELEEPLVVRPTSEMIIGESFSRWIESYRDLPLKLNQWANIVRWEMRTRLFLRTAEILWQEGHTAHATKEEAVEETNQMLDIYVEISEKLLAIPVIKGQKSEREKFPGADTTLCFEAMMQDGKALQMGTSHFLGQNFSKAADITFTDQEGKLQHAWTTSWGVTTRLIGAIIMTHSDDNGLILPPRVASAHVVIIPFIPKNGDKESICEYCEKLKQQISSVNYHGSTLDVKVDDRDLRSGEKAWQWIKKGVPLRIEVGPKEMEANKVSLFKRTEDPKQRHELSEKEVTSKLSDILDDIQKELFARAKGRLNSQTKEINSKEEFYEYFKQKNPGFALVHYNPDHSFEEKIQQDLGVTVRCIPLEKKKEKGICPFSNQESSQRVIYAKSY